MQCKHTFFFFLVVSAYQSTPPIRIAKADARELVWSAPHGCAKRTLICNARVGHLKLAQRNGLAQLQVRSHLTRSIAES